jgi:telomere length regulation protein
MVVGTAISDLVDSEGKKMKFSMSDIDSDDGLWYRNLVKSPDTIGTLSDWKAVIARETDDSPKPPISKPRIKPHKPVQTKPSTTSKIIAIEEVTEGDEEDDEDLPMYQNPDSDEEDEDEDATLVQRNKPTAPV